MRQKQVKKNVWSQEMLDELRAMHEAGASIKAMCEHFGKQPDSIRLHLDRLGLIVIGEGKDWTLDMKNGSRELRKRMIALIRKMAQEQQANDASVHEDGMA
jgi:beta-galactosidase/beta-glucuronidase